jgi:hypothetical protein
MRSGAAATESTESTEIDSGFTSVVSVSSVAKIYLPRPTDALMKSTIPLTNFSPALPNRK